VPRLFWFSVRWACAMLLFVWPMAAAAQPDSSDESPESDRGDEASDAEAKQRAKELFERGVALMGAENWSSALEEFLVSRELSSTRDSTLNAAVCLRELDRSDEALGMFESLLADFPKLTPKQREAATREVIRLRQRVGTLELRVSEPGAEVLIDGRHRGTSPLSTRVRLSAGPHFVMVFKSGFEVFRTNVDVPAQRHAQLDARLEALAKSGQLTITTVGGEQATIVLDGVQVGFTPWTDEIGVGTHSVVLRGWNNRGTPPVAARVHENEITMLTLEVLPLDSTLRVQPTPVSASVAIDGIDVGRGIWDGRLPAGDHRIEVGAVGFIPRSVNVSLEAYDSELVRVALERDGDSTIWTDKRPSHFFVEAQAAAAASPGLGGDIDDGCLDGCDGDAALGGIAMLRGGYQFGSGVIVSLDLGYLLLHQSLANRATTLTPRGLERNVGVADDELSLSGVLLGGSAGYGYGDDVRLSVRVGGGVMLGTVSDERSGTFTTQAAGVQYEVGPLMESKSTQYAYVGPELRVGYHFADRFTVSATVQGLLLLVLSQPSWTNESRVLAGRCGATSLPAECEGEAEFDRETFAGSTVAVVSPGFAATFEF